MANKTYAVIKDGEELNVYKLFPAAKKLADAEGAEVFCGGERVYKPDSVASVSAAPVNAETAMSNDGKTQTSIAPRQEYAGTFRLTSLMNVRAAPSMTAPILGTRKAGTMVSATEKDGWLSLADGTFILWDNGQFAVKI